MCVGGVLVHTQFKLEYFSVGVYLIITEKHRHPGIFGFLSNCEHFTVTAQR